MHGSELPLSTVPALTLGGFAEPLRPLGFYQFFKQVEVLQLVECKGDLVKELLKEEGEEDEEPHLPKLHMILMNECEFNDVTHTDTDDTIATALKTVLTQRTSLGLPIQKLHIECCGITEEVVDGLKELVDVEWDGIWTESVEHSDSETDSELETDSECSDVEVEGTHPPGSAMFVTE